MTTPWERFKEAARLGAPGEVPVAIETMGTVLAVDRGWLAH